MRDIHVSEITRAVARLCVDANYNISEDVGVALRRRCQEEESPLGQEILTQLVENNALAQREQVPICQDTGMAIIFLEIGQEVHVVGGDLTQAVNEGVAKGYTQGYLRKSVVSEPVYDRKNTGDNTPAILHMTVVPGDKICITVSPKGFGSENMSALRMFKPSEGLPAIRKLLVDTVTAAGPNPCPPIILGIGMGGNFEKVAWLAKKALMRPIGSRNPDERYARLEQELLELVNKTGIGPMGLGGTTTCLAVHIEHYPTHIASMPVAINVSCHATRHKSCEI